MTLGSKFLFGSLLACAMLSPAMAQTNAPGNPPPAAVTTAKPSGELWRASKLVGLNVYNDQNEKLGDISEILIDKAGKVNGVVIGVGGLLGMGQHDIMVDMAKLKFVDEPVRTSSTATTTGAGTANRPATTTTSSSDHKWYPDHAVLSGASKDQLNSMPEFKY
jgi:sporulation protein YlmC with PRC-barrel domain